MSHVPAIILLMIVYMASMIGFTTPHQQAWYLYYTPYFLLLNALIFAAYQKQWNKQLVSFWASVLVTGCLVEVIAVHTSVLYGNYFFGGSLGHKIVGVPIIMPIYWLIVVASTAVIAGKLLPKNALGRILLGALLTIGLSLLIQQVAVRLDFWYVTTNQLWRYLLVQLIINVFLQYLFIRWRVSSENVIAGYIYGGLLIFFIGVVSFLK